MLPRFVYLTENLYQVCYVTFYKMQCEPKLALHLVVRISTVLDVPQTQRGVGKAGILLVP